MLLQLMHAHIARLCTPADTDINRRICVHSHMAFRA
jgi:hypothetical protein